MTFTLSMTDMVSVVICVSVITYFVLGLLNILELDPTKEDYEKRRMKNRRDYPGLYKSIDKISTKMKRHTTESQHVETEKPQLPTAVPYRRKRNIDVVRERMNRH